jgi:hypothetical protein
MSSYLLHLMAQGILILLHKWQKEITFAPHGSPILIIITTLLFGDCPTPQDATPFQVVSCYPFRDDKMEQIVISPEPFIQKCRSLAKGKNLHLEVVDKRVRIAWTRSPEGQIDFMERIDVIGLGISYDMLLDALLDAGGTIDSDGHYPINNAIRHILMNILK